MLNMRTRELYWKSLEALKTLVDSGDSRIKPFYCPIQQRRNQGIFAVNIHAKIGFFAQLNWCLYIFAHCERFNLRPVIRLTSPFYVSATGDSWLDYFFENRRLTVADRSLIEDGTIKFSQISELDQLGLPTDYGSTMTLEIANQLLWDYLGIRKEIEDYVESYADRHFKNRITLGVHYRGTDKVTEAPPVSREYIAETISKYLDANSKVDALFVASDESGFIKWIQQEFKSVEVLAHNDTKRSADGKPIHVHTTPADNYMKGKEALVNSMLLSKCSMLIRASSFLSAWSSIFNPQLPVIMLNRPFDSKSWFPDALLAKKSLNEYLPEKI